MKTLLYWFFFAVLLLGVGCQSQDARLSQATERWKLTEVIYTSMVAGQPNSSIPPPYEEILELKADSTFRRYRSTGYEATGTYTRKQYSADDQGFLATFNDKSLAYHELPGYRQYSFAEGQVYFRQTEPDKLLESYAAADGPTFVYRKVKDQE